jgi:DNA-binding protein H-NS
MTCYKNVKKDMLDKYLKMDEKEISMRQERNERKKVWTGRGK